MAVDEPLFQPFPHELHYHRYNEFEPIEATIWLRNNDNVSLAHKLLPLASSLELASTCSLPCLRLSARSLQSG